MQIEADASEALAGTDSVQQSLMAEAVIQVTENDDVLGPISKFDAHHIQGKFHLAFRVMLFDS